MKRIVRFLNKPISKRYVLAIRIFALTAFIFDIFFIPWMIIKVQAERVRIATAAQIDSINIDYEKAIYYGNYEYCVQRQDSRASDLPDPVFVPVAEVPIPTVPAATPVPPPTIDLSNIKFVGPDNYEPENLHVMLVGIAYSEADSEHLLPVISDVLKVNFEGIAVDFAYTLNYLDADFEHVGETVRFVNDADADRISEAVKSVYTFDILVFVVNTNLPVGTAHLNKYSILTGNDPNTTNIASHEIAHQMGLGDGYSGNYTSYYAPGELPNSELFMEGKMTYHMVESLKELPEIPDLYLMGTCKGEPLYSFYHSGYNLMGDNNVVGQKPWGDTLFTPLQRVYMQLFVADKK